jgi:hypothetical protein
MPYSDPEKRANCARRGCKKYYWRNRLAMLERARIYRVWHTDERARKQRAYVRRRMAEDPSYRLRITLQIDFAARQRRAKVAKPTPFLVALGCSWEAFTAFLEKRFPPGVTWANYSDKGLECDHKFPFKCFDLRKSLDRACVSHWSNLRMITREANRSKNGKFNRSELKQFKAIWKALYGPRKPKQLKLADPF